MLARQLALTRLLHGHDSLEAARVHVSIANHYAAVRQQFQMAFEHAKVCRATTTPSSSLYLMSTSTLQSAQRIVRALKKSGENAAADLPDVTCRLYYVMGLSLVHLAQSSEAAKALQRALDLSSPIQASE